MKAIHRTRIHVRPRGRRIARKQGRQEDPPPYPRSISFYCVRRCIWQARCAASVHCASGVDAGFFLTASARVLTSGGRTLSFHSTAAPAQLVRLRVIGQRLDLVDTGVLRTCPMGSQTRPAASVLQCVRRPPFLPDRTSGCICPLLITKAKCRDVERARPCGIFSLLVDAEVQRSHGKVRRPARSRAR